jgi:hypothetical protein
MSRAVHLLALVALCGSAVLAQAQDRVYRCGVAYSHEPCTDGRGIDVADTRSAQQAAQARQVALRDAREADALERQRLQTERLAASQGPVLIGPSLKSVRLDDVRCANPAACSRSEPKKRRHDKAPPVALYHAVGAR